MTLPALISIMNAVAQHLEFEARNLSSALATLVEHFRRDAPFLGDNNSNAHQDTSTPRLSVLPGAGPEIHEAKRSLLASMSKLHWLLDEPAEFMQNLIIQSQLVSCLTWLAEFQVLAYIPLGENVPISDIAELAGLPASQLARVVRMTATAGFLLEPQPDHVAHTSLSAAFVQRLHYLDATLFLGKVSAPEGLRMAERTKRGDYYLEDSGSDGRNDNTCKRRTETQKNLPTRLSLQNPKLQRSWSTFLQCLGDVDDSIDEVLLRLDWNSLGKATIVDIFARSVSEIKVLAQRFPALSFIVQSDNISSMSSANGKTSSMDSCVDYVEERISIQSRTPGSSQTTTDAAVYLLRMPSPSSSSSPSPSSSGQQGATTCSSSLVFNDRDSLRHYMHSELTAHLDVLRANPAAKFVLSFRPLPEAGAKGVVVAPHVEAMARARDLAKMTLTNGGDLELRDVLGVVEGVQDEQGRLAVINKIQCQNSATVVVSIRYQPWNKAD